MPRNEKCAKYSECLAGLGETEIDWHCDHCDPEDADVALVLRALHAPAVQDAILAIVSCAINRNPAISKAIRRLQCNLNKSAKS